MDSDPVFEALVANWVKVYRICIKGWRYYQERLNELQTWDDSNDNQLERRAKIEALKRLILEGIDPD